MDPNSPKRERRRIAPPPELGNFSNLDDSGGPPSTPQRNQGNAPERASTPRGRPRNLEEHFQGADISGISPGSDSPAHGMSGSMQGQEPQGQVPRTPPRPQGPRQRRPPQSSQAGHQPKMSTPTKDYGNQRDLDEHFKPANARRIKGVGGPYLRAGRIPGDIQQAKMDAEARQAQSRPQQQGGMAAGPQQQGGMAAGPRQQGGMAAGPQQQGGMAAGPQQRQGGGPSTAQAQGQSGPVTGPTPQGTLVGRIRLWRSKFQNFMGGGQQR